MAFTFIPCKSVFTTAGIQKLVYPVIIRELSDNVLLISGVVQNIYDVSTDTETTEHAIFTFPNTAKITLYYVGNNQWYAAYWHAGADHADFTFQINARTSAQKYLTFALSADKTAVYMADIYTDRDNGIRYRVESFFALYDILDYFSENPNPFTWKPFNQLAGNNGQFRLDLAQIKEEYIGDGETQSSASDPIHPSEVIFSENARMGRIAVNLLDGEETVIAYSGMKYMTATKTSGTSVTLKLYSESGIIMYTSDSIYSDDRSVIQYYLSFIIDEIHEVAALDLIQKYAPTDPAYTPSVTWNRSALPNAPTLYKIYVWLTASNSEQEANDPYSTGTTDDGGEPGLPRPQDHITDSTLPTTGGLGNTIVTLYRPTSAQLSAIARYLWSDDVLDNFKKYFNNFADNILNLYTLPFTPSNLSTKTFKVGNLTSEIPNVEYCETRFFDINMGSVNVQQKWGSYLDYSPYSKCEIYLPYLGLHSLDIDEIMSPCKMDGSMPAEQGSTLSLVYRLDILTGVIVAKVKINGEIRYQFSGKVGATIPLTGQTFAQLVQGIVTAGAGLITTVATSGMAAPMVASAAAIAGTIQAQKPNVERIGNISGDASMLATNVPYIILTTPNKPYLEKQQEFTGFPSYKSGLLSEFSGYTEVIDAHVEGISCTDQERAEILSLLKAGVIL